MLEPVTGRADRLEAELVGGRLEPLQHGVEGRVADDVEAGLQPGPRAGDDVPGDLLGREVGVP